MITKPTALLYRKMLRLRQYLTECIDWLNLEIDFLLE